MIKTAWFDPGETKGSQHTGVDSINKFIWDNHISREDIINVMFTGSKYILVYFVPKSQSVVV